MNFFKTNARDGMFIRNICFILLAMLVFPGCTTLELFKTAALHFTSPLEEEGNGHYKVGEPYQIAGRWYHPREDHAYQETGMASWYGQDFHRKKTANGEIFDKNALTAAHKTLPLPSMVRVENLENGRAVLVRVNDRGPFAKNRIIDVSEKAARLLGFHGDGTAQVRVTFDRQATERMFAELGKGPYSRPEKDGGVMQVAAASNASGIFPSGHFIQAGAYSDYQKALKDARRLAHSGAQVQIANMRAGDQRVYKVRMGPFEKPDAAGETLEHVQKLGFKDAVVVTN